jgi:hypothetical protein
MLIFNGLLWQWITFNAYYFQKNLQITGKVTFVANGQLSALISPGRQATGNFQRLIRPIQQTKTTEVTF